MAQSISFHGAAETVTGSRHLLTLNGRHVLVDCGLFQGGRELSERNWLTFPVDPQDIDAVVLTHAHMDHIGWLPRLVAQGYSGPIYATHATVALARISLPDSARIQEEDARRANRHLEPGRAPELPLYNEAAAYACLKQFVPIKYDTFHELPGRAQWRYLPAGHIMGSAFAEIYFENGERILMSGDLGRFDTPIIKDPTAIDYAEYLVVESTYGDRLHAHEDTAGRLEEIFSDAMRSGGTVLVPSFAIGRTQELLYYISQLQHAGRLPRIPIFIDSPMAVSTTHLYIEESQEHDEEMALAVAEQRSPLEPTGITFIRDKEQSKALNAQKGPLVIIAGSGMATAGRIVHHLRNRISRPETTVLFTGYQAEGTLGRRLLEGAEVARIMGEEVSVNARIEKLNSLSAHADQAEIMRWLSGFKRPPKRTFIVHGEPPAQQAIAEKIKAELGWDVVIPKWGETFSL